MTKKQKLISNVLLLFIILITIYKVVIISKKTDDHTIEYKPTNIYGGVAQLVRAQDS